MIPFVKMHGIGNDYVYVDAGARQDIERRADLADLARRVSDRHRGVGSDGLILVCPPSPAGTGAHVRMRMFNADGSESEMCGNGVRCVAKFAHDRLGVTANPMLVQTGRGVLSIAYETDAQGRLATATVDMGEPILAAADVPTTLPASRAGAAVDVRWPAAAGLELDGFDGTATAVSMGNPHAVLFGRDVRRVALEQVGPVLERDVAFPRRVNVHVVEVVSRSHLRMRTWERGAGITQACGTGACAVLVAAVLSGLSERTADIDLPGGRLRICWDAGERGHVFMTGPAADAFEGVWPG